METDYKVKLEVFEGPLDLLLYLIKRDEIDIYDISLELINALQTVIKRAEAREDLQQLFGEHYTVSDKIESILRQIASGVTLKFSELFAQMASRVEIVVTFLALLELIRLKQVRASQSSPFEEIEIAPAVLN